jgi:phospholipid-binding lipoprotein MlaA
MYHATAKRARNMFKTILATGCMATALAACASSANDDPLEPLNRSVFHFNEVIDTYALRPIAKGYVAVIPETGRTHIGNVLDNLKMPLVFANSILQGDGTNAMSAFWSFTLNSTFGLAGIFDFVGSNTHLHVHDEDFGQTMAVWGVDSGAYIVLPLFGPSTVRDTFGLAVDVATEPFNYTDDVIAISYGVIDTVHTRSTILDLVDSIYESSLDPYATIRSGYLQKRRADIKNTKSEVIKEGL